MRRFLIDNQLPGTLVPWLEAKGCLAQHVLSLNLAQSPDEVIWSHASREDMVLVSKDEDFARLSIMRAEQVSVVWVRIGNCRTSALLAVLDRAWLDINRQLDAGARLIEVQ